MKPCSLESDATKDAETKLKNPSTSDLPPELTSLQVGIWRIIFERDSSAVIEHGPSLWSSCLDVLLRPFTTPSALSQQLWQQIQETHLPQLIMDVHALGPGLFWIMILSHVLTGVESALLLWLSNRLLILIEMNVKNPSADATAIIWALVYRLGCVAIINSWRWFSSRYTSILKARVKLFFQERLMAAHLSQDLSDSRKPSYAIDASPLNGWYALQNLLGSLDVAFSTLSQIALLVNITLSGGVVRPMSPPHLELGNGNGTVVPSGTDNAAYNGMGNGVVILAMCLVWPVVNRMLKHDLDGKMYIAHVIDPHYIRAKALYDIATNSLYKREVISGTLGEYIQREHAQARAPLKAITDEYPASTYKQRGTPWPDVILGLLDDLPLVYYAISSVVYREGGLSIAALAMLHQTLGITRNTLERILIEKRGFGENLRTVRTIYDFANEVPIEVSAAEVSEAKQPTAVCSAQGGVSGSQGIGIELRNVTFAYPSASTDDASVRPALSNVSFVIPPSSLVVIVGANGSGKSSLVNLLSCVYKPTSGSILFDGVDPAEAPIGRKMQDCQRATAVLTQDHSLFPAFSIWENIAIGDPELCLSWSYLPLAERKARLQDRIREAARLGGALDFIEKQNKKFDEVIAPVYTSFGSMYPMPDGPLKDVMNKLEMWRDISGGEVQRLAASRTFMRLMNPNTRLVIVDEPTSAMDPLGEFELFKKLRGMRSGKTMVFVTHRFGHLTKYADIILCMKDGELVEIGTHRELMAQGGEYSQLYGIQASAFSDAPQDDHGATGAPSAGVNDVGTEDLN